MATCVDLWNKRRRSELFFVTDPAVLVTTDPAGNCLIALDSFAGGSDGSVGAVAFNRSPEGIWSLYIASDTPDIERRHAESVIWEEQRALQPNAYVVASPSYLEFDPSAPLPDGAQTRPALVTQPVRTPCNSTLTFTGGSIGSFTVTIEQATGISCEEARELAGEILYRPDGYQGFECSVAGSIRRGRFSCSKGHNGFSFSSAPTAALPNEDDAPPTGEEDEGILGSWAGPAVIEYESGETDDFVERLRVGPLLIGKVSGFGEAIQGETKCRGPLIFEGRRGSTYLFRGQEENTAECIDSSRLELRRIGPDTLHYRELTDVSESKGTLEPR